MLRERFDRIEIVDLRGDLRTGERAGVSRDQGVFSIRVGTAITLALANGSKANGELAEVRYTDSWAEGLFAREAKLNWLMRGAEIGKHANTIEIRRGALDDMRPEPFLNGELISIEQCFSFYRSGLQTKRDSLVYDPKSARLVDRIGAFLAADNMTAKAMFHDSRDRKWRGARTVSYDPRNIIEAGYRPLDNRYLYNHRAYGDFLRPELQKVWGKKNTCLYAMPFGTGEGPAVWCHGVLPDYHAFSGRGGYAFPLYDRRPDVNAHNLASRLIQGLSAAYGGTVLAPDVFDATLCLLSASSYTLRFAEDLEDIFPHVPFSAHLNMFDNAVRVGREIRAVETFGRDPRGAYQQPEFVRLESQPRGAVEALDYEAGSITLCANGSGKITGLPDSVWNFSVSGYRVLPRWLEARIGLPADFTFVRELRNICGRIAELVDLFTEADTVLEATLRDTLTREALGFEPARQATDDGTD